MKLNTFNKNHDIVSLNCLVEDLKKIHKDIQHRFILVLNNVEKSQMKIIKEIESLSEEAEKIEKAKEQLKSIFTRAKDFLLGE